MSTKIDPIVVKYCKTKDDSLKSEIIKNYKPLIEYIARKLAFNRNDIDDLYQVGSIAVIKCLDRFDLSKNVDAFAAGQSENAKSVARSTTARNPF